MGNMIDWSTEYDIFDPQYIADPFTIWDQLRGTCPVAHTDKYQGSWLPTTYETVTEMARDIEHFSSRSVSVVPPLMEGGGAAIFLALVEVISHYTDFWAMYVGIAVIARVLLIRDGLFVVLRRLVKP